VCECVRQHSASEWQCPHQWLFIAASAKMHNSNNSTCSRVVHATARVPRAQTACCRGMMVNLPHTCRIPKESTRVVFGLNCVCDWVFSSSGDACGMPAPGVAFGWMDGMGWDGWHGWMLTTTYMYGVHSAHGSFTSCAQG
jgi:hypothetical protein